MSDLRVYRVLTGFHIFGDISEQIANQLDNYTPITEILLTALAHGIKDDGTPANVKEWHVVSDDFAEMAKKLGEVIAYTPLGIAWGRQSNIQPLYNDHLVQKIFDSLY